MTTRNARPTGRHPGTTLARIGAGLLVALLGAVLLVATGAAPATASADEVATRLNQARSAAGVPPLARSSAMDVVAQRWSQRMAADGALGHNPSYSQQIPSGWDRAAENVAYGGDVASVHQSLMGSPPHRANMLDRDLSSVGVGHAVDQQGRVWVTQVFARYPGVTASAVPTSTTPVAGDFDGDGRDSVGTYSRGVFVLPVGGSTVRFAFGRAGDVPVVGDWDRDGEDEVGVFRAGRWHLRDHLSSGPANRSFSFGRAGDQPFTGRWTGSGQGIGVKRGASWFLRSAVGAGPATTSTRWAWAGDRPMAGYWSGAVRDSIGIWRAGSWHLSRTPTSHQVTSARLGGASDVPLVGDWDGDGVSTTAIVRGATVLWRDDHRGGAATGSAALPR